MAGKKGMHDKHRFSEEYLNRLRGKIKTSKLLLALQKHVFEGKDMSSTQVQAASVLLRKVMPDTQQQEVTQKGEGLLDVFKRLAEERKAALAEKDDVQTQQYDSGAVHH